MKMLDVGTGQLVTVRLYGVLGSKFGRVHRLAVTSAAEAVRALSAQLRGFDAFLAQSKDKGLGYAVFYGKHNLTEEQLRTTCGQHDIRIAPVIIGSKSGGWLNIIIGAILLVVSVVLDYFTGGAFGAATGYATYAMGVSMIVGGVVQLLTPVPKGRAAEDRPENRPSYMFNGPVNTQAQGGCVPVLYGELIVGSAVISAGIEVKDQAYIPRTTTGVGYGGGGGGGATNYHYQLQ